MSGSLGRLRQLAAVAMLTLALGVSGCARRGVSAAADAPALDAEWSLTVINRHSLDVTIHVISSGLRAHVGSVSSARTESYVLPGRMVGASLTVRLEAAAIGSTQRTTTDGMLIRAGQHVEWTLENGLQRSSVTVW